MPSFQIESVLGHRVWTGRYGPMLSYDCEFKTEQGIARVEWSKKPDSPEPKVGETVEGELESTTHGMKFKQARSAPAGAFRGKSPIERNEIARMASQRTAVELLAVEVAAGKSPDKLMQDAFLQRVEMLYQDIKKAGAE